MTGMFEALVASDSEIKYQRREAANQLTAAVYDVRGRFGPFLFEAKSLEEYRDRLALVKNDLIKTMQPHVFPRAGVIRRVLKPIEAEFRQKLAADTGGNYLPPSDVTGPHGATTDVGWIANQELQGPPGVGSPAVATGSRIAADDTPLVNAVAPDAGGVQGSVGGAATSPTDPSVAAPGSGVGGFGQASGQTADAMQGFIQGRKVACGRCEGRPEGEKCAECRKEAAYDGAWPTSPTTVKDSSSIYEALRKGAPFAGYSDFEACVRANSDKRDPQAYCGYIKHRVEDNKQSSLREVMRIEGMLSRNDLTAALNELRRLTRTAEDRRRGLASRTAGRLDALQRIINNHQAEEVDGHLVDAQTAHLLLTLHGQGNDKTKAAIENAPLHKVVDTAWKLTAKRTADKTGPAMQIEKTYQRSRGPLVPEGEFKEYLDRVDQGAREKVRDRFVDTESPVTEHTMDPEDHDFAPKPSYLAGKSAVQHFASWCQQRKVRPSMDSLEVWAAKCPDREYYTVVAALQRHAQMPGEAGGMEDARIPLGSGGAPPSIPMGSGPQVGQEPMATPGPAAGGATIPVVTPGGGRMGGQRRAQMPGGAPAPQAPVQPVQPGGGIGSNPNASGQAGYSFSNVTGIGDFGVPGADGAASPGRTGRSEKVDKMSGRGLRRIAAPDYLQKADQALTDLLNQKAEEFQQGVGALQQALQIVQQEEQAQQAANPLNVQPPAGTVNVLPQAPQGLQPAAGPDQGGAPDPNGGQGAPPPAAGDPNAVPPDPQLQQMAAKRKRGGPPKVGKPRAKRTAGERSWSCKRCGDDVSSWGGRDTGCRNCGAQYNGFGQRLRDDWRDNPSNYDDDIGDLEGYEIEQARKGASRGPKVGKLRAKRGGPFGVQTWPGSMDSYFEHVRDENARDRELAHQYEQERKRENRDSRGRPPGSQHYREEESAREARRRQAYGPPDYAGNDANWDRGPEPDWHDYTCPECGGKGGRHAPGHDVGYESPEHLEYLMRRKRGDRRLVDSIVNGRAANRRGDHPKGGARA